MTMYTVNQTGETASAAVTRLLKDLLDRNIADAVLVSAENPWSRLPMPTVFTDSGNMDRVVPLAPSAAVSYARQASLLVRQPSDKTVALVMKPCEVRAFIELAKLNQCSLDHAILVSMDCPGRLENGDYLTLAAEKQNLGEAFPADLSFQEQLTATCASCDAFIPVSADLQFCVTGMDGQLGVKAGTAKGEDIAARLNLSKIDEPQGRAEALSQLAEKRKERKTALFEETASTLKSIEGFQTYISRCINCYNCRAACPVCYCRECVFLTDVFAYPPDMLLERAKRRGLVKMPTDTTMFHMTRMSHIAHACVGCGQCTSVCPSEIPVADLFRTVAEKTQSYFDYMPGRDVLEPIPQLVAKKGRSQE
jgi:formate dehydrogenase subunit beta